jgi:hypothetical protein
VLELWPGWLAGGGGGQYPLGRGNDSHILGYSAMGDPSHGITVGGPI